MDENGGITFCRRNVLVSQCQKILWGSVQGFRKIGVSKTFMLNRGYLNFPSKIFCLTVPETFVREPHCFWEKFRFQKVLWMKTGVSRFPVGKFWSHSAEKFRGHPFIVSENLGYRTILCIIWVSQFSVETFLSHSAETFRGHSFNVSENWGYRTILCIRGVSQFSVESFLSHSVEKFRGHPFKVSENLGYRKVICLLGGITKFRQNFFVSQCRNISWAFLQCLRKLGASKTFMHTGGYHVFPSKHSGLTVPKNFVGITSMFLRIWGIEKFYA